MTAAIKAGNAYVEISARDKALKDAIEANAQRMKSFAKNVALIGASASLAAAATAIKAASTMEEQLNKFNVVFGESSAAVRAWADEFASQVGRSQRQIVEFLGATQDLLVPAGIDPAAAEAMSKTLTSLAVDVASFNNKLDADVLRDFHSALTGGGETVKKYGVLLNVATTNAELLEQGINPKSATDAQKVYARLQILLKGTTAAQGDAVRSGQSFANQSKRLVAVMEDLGMAIGQVLLPATTALLTKVTAGVTTFAQWVQQNQEFIHTLIQMGVAAGAVVGTVLVLTKGLRLYRAAAVAAQAASGPVGWLMLGAGLLAGAAAIGVMGTATEGLAEDLKSLKNEASTAVKNLTELNGKKIEVEVEADTASSLQKIQQIRDQLNGIDDSKNHFTISFNSLAELRTEVTSEPDLDQIRRLIKESRGRLQNEVDSQQKTMSLEALSRIEQKVILTGVLESRNEVAQAEQAISELQAEVRNAMSGEAAANPAALIDGLNTMMDAMGDMATGAEQVKQSEINRMLAHAQATQEAGKAAAAQRMFAFAAEETATLTGSLTGRLIEQRDALSDMLLVANNDALKTLMASQVSQAEKLAEKLKVVADRRAMIASGVDDGTFSSSDLDDIESRLINSATGFGDEMRRVQDDIAILNGTLTETDQKLREMAENGLPPDKAIALRKEYEKLNAAKAAAEDTKKAEKLLKKQQDRADEIRDAFKTPQERIAEVAAEIDELIKAKVLDTETGKKFLNAERQRILDEVQGSLADRERASGQTRRESSQDLRSSAGQSMLTNVLNRTGDIERTQLQSLQRAEQHQARVVELIERGKRKATV